MTKANRQLRSFGFVVGAGFAVIGVLPAIIRHHGVRTWPLAMSLALFAAAVIYPPVLRPFQRVWMAFGETLGWINSRIILTVIYYLIIVPIGAIRRMSGSDPMRRNYDRSATTYKIPRARRPASHMQRQY